jgi:hypothetical protein
MRRCSLVLRASGRGLPSPRDRRIRCRPLGRATSLGSGERRMGLCIELVGIQVIGIEGRGRYHRGEHGAELWLLWMTWRQLTRKKKFPLIYRINMYNLGPVISRTTPSTPGMDRQVVVDVEDAEHTQKAPILPRFTALHTTTLRSTYAAFKTNPRLISRHQRTETPRPIPQLSQRWMQIRMRPRAR